ncbi:leucine-rich repeat domain-containing protein [Enterococcus sp. AZ103]|uniref:leucine-rich repeat domain-containing protein n=1 Tax=Enterococcus sp. AZ103 TaxID=2774628 RepID=UPI003F25271F
MIKKILTGVCTLLILGSSFPAPTIFAETVDPLTDTEATMPTITDEPTVAAQSIINKDVPADTLTTEAGSSSSSESKAQGTTNTTSSTNKAAKEVTTKATSDSEKEAVDSEVEAQSDSETDEVATGDISDALRAKAAKVHGIEPAAVNDKTPMVERTFGEDDPETYMLDDTLSLALRSSGMNITISGGLWSGDLKDPGKLTIGDMKTLQVVIVSDGGHPPVFSLVRDLIGLEYAINMDELDCSMNDLTSLDLTKNLKLSKLNCRSNKITDFSLYNNGANIESLSCFGNKIADFTKVIQAQEIYADRQEITIPLSDVKVDAENKLKIIDTIKISDNIDLTTATYTPNSSSSNSEKEATIEGNTMNFENISKQTLSEGSILYDSDESTTNSGFFMYACTITFEDYNPQLLSEGDNSLEYSIDKNLSTALRAQSGWDGYRKNAGELTVDDMVTLTKAAVSYRNLQSIKGLEFATNLTELNCSNNQLTSLEQLKGLPLVDLNCRDNQLTSLEPIKDLPIEVLDFSKNKVSDVSCLFTSKTLDRVTGSNNSVSDISGFSGLSSLYMGSQSITIPVETWSAIEDQKLVLNNLRTTGETDRMTIVETTYPQPSGSTISWDGDQITFSGYTRRDLSGGIYYTFEYDSAKLTGAETIEFYGRLVLEADDNHYLFEGLEGEGQAGIDSKLAEILRTDKAATNDGGPWSGFKKPVNNITAADMENLTSIDVSGKELTSLFGMYHAKNLIKFKANNNQLTSLNHLLTTTLLEEINVDDNQLTSLNFGYFAEDLATKRISANNNQLTNLDDLAGMTKLEEISLNDNQLTNLDGLTDMTTLEEISVNDNQLTNLDPLANNTSMKRLSAKNNKIIDIKTVEGFSELEVADLQGQRIQSRYRPQFTIRRFNDDFVNYFARLNVLGTADHTNYAFSVRRSDNSIEPDASASVSVPNSVNFTALRRSAFNNGTTLYFERDKNILADNITFTGNISFLEYTGTVLREVDDYLSYSDTINTKFAELLRTNSDLTNGGEAWSGDGKPVNRLTDLDMEALTSIDVSNSDLTSIQGIEFAAFLKSFKANNNDIGRVDLRQVDLTGNKELETLELNHNSLTTLDLKNQTKLTSLDCGSNQMTNSQIFSGLTNLTTLKIGGNSFDNFDGISGLTDLTTLAVNDSKLSDLDILNDFPNLKSLDISNNQLSDISKVSDLKNLTTLNADKNQIKDITSIEQMSNLKDATLDEQSLQPSYPRFWKDGDQFKATIDYLKMNVSNGVTFTADTDNASGVSVKTEGNNIIAISGSKVNLEGQTISFKRTGKGISFSGTLEYSEATLSEGRPNDGSNGDYDIDADFSEAIRKGSGDAQKSDYTPWSGRGKEANTLTRADMESIATVIVHDIGLDSVKGLNFAKNLEYFGGEKNNLTNLDDFSENGKLTAIDVPYNKISDITGIPFNNGMLAAGTQIISMDFPDFKKQSDGTYKATIDLLKIPNMSASPWTTERYMLYDDGNEDSPVTASKEAGSNKLVLSSATFPKMDQLSLEFEWRGPNRLFAGMVNIESEEFLKEGSPGDTEPYDIDATLAQALRSGEAEVTTVSGNPWSGKDKPADRISKRDMADILSIKAVSQNLASLYGIEHATNLQTINVNQNKLTSLNELKSNAELTAIDASENQINDISVIGGLTKLTTVNAKDQAFTVDYYPTFTADGANYKTTVDPLKMPTGYSVESAKIVDETQNKKATIKPNGAAIDVTGLMRSILNGHQLNFSVTQPMNPAVSFNGNISFAAYAGTKLIEGSENSGHGFDLHTNLAARLRDKKINGVTIAGGGEWVGKEKARNQITDLDMEELIGIYIRPSNMSSLKGIEYATNITSLSAYQNAITDVNLTKNIKLTSLNIGRNSLTSIDLTQNTALTALDVSINSLQSIDLSKNTELISFQGQSNSSLKTIDFSKNTKLTTINTGSTGLTEIDLSMLPDLADVRVYSCDNLERMIFGEGNAKAMTTLFCRSNPKITEVEGINFLTNLTTLQFYANNISDIDSLSDLKNLTTLNISQNQISDISSLSGKPKLTTLNASNQQIQVDIPRFDLSKGTGIVDVLTTTNGTGLTANLVASDLEGVTVTNTADSDDITIGGIAARDFAGQSISFEYAGASLGEGATTADTKTFDGTITFNEYTGRKLIEGVPDASGNEDYDLNKILADRLRKNSGDWTTNTGLWSGTNKPTNEITDLDMEELITITVAGGSGSVRGNLTSIKGVNFATNITSLNARYHRITKVDLTNNTKLSNVVLRQNQLKTIDLSNNTDLTRLEIDNNQLEVLDVSNNKELTELIIHVNKISDISSFKNLTKLVSLNAHENQISDISSVSELTMLNYLNINTNQVSEVPSLEKLTSLTTLTLRNNQIRDLTNVEALKNQTTVNLTANLSNQTFKLAYPTFTEVEGKYTTAIDHLKMTDSSTLSATIADSDAEITYDASQIIITGSSRSVLNGKTISFERNTTGITFTGTIDFDEYAGTALREGPTDLYPTDYDLDTNLGDLLSKEKNPWNKANVTNLGNAWSGLKKGKHEITDLDMEQLTLINGAGVSSNYGNLTSLKGINYAINLKKLNVDRNQLTDVDVTKNLVLDEITLIYNRLETIDVTQNKALSTLLMSDNKIQGTIDTSQNENLTILNVYNQTDEKLEDKNNLTSLDLDNNKKLKELNVGNNPNLKKVTLNNKDNFDHLVIYNTGLTELDLSNTPNLKYLNASNNQISDISGFINLTKLATMNVSNQKLTTSIPLIDGTKKAEVDLLKTTAGSILTTSRNSTNLITPEAEYGSVGDKAVLSNVTRSSLSGKSYNFSYSNLQEGATSGTKSFNGTVTFDKVSDTNQTLEADKTKAEIGETVGFSWNVYSIGDIDMKDVQAKLDLPEGLAVDAESIKVTNGTAITPPADFNNEISIGDIVKGASATITFNATVQDTEVLKWLTTTGTVTWADTTGDATRFTSTATTKVQVKDDQQSYTPSNEGLAITSVPAGFNFGYRSRSDKEALYPLRESDYQYNTKVPQNGFYVRVQNNQSTNSGWSLSASLSNFSNQQGIMPFGNGTSLNFSSMSIKNVLQPDTEDEIFNDSPTGIPSTVGTTELASGGSPQRLTSADQAQGAGTWQLQIPFNGVELQLPSNAGKTGEKYNATVSWSLDNTP